MSILEKLLDGVDVEWKTLSQIGEVAGAGVDKKSSPDEKKVTLLNYMDVYRNNLIDSSIPKMIVTGPDRKITQCNILKEDIFFTPSSEVLNDIGNSAVATEDIKNAVYSYHLMRLRLHNKRYISAYFISIMLGSKTVQVKLIKMPRA